MTPPIPRPKRSRRVFEPPAPEVLLLGPPELHLIGDNGSLITEPLTVVVTITAPDTAREELRLYGICMDHAQHRTTTDNSIGQWMSCLVSVECHAMLESLRDIGQFPYPFDAQLSEAEARWQLARAQGADTRERLPMRLYVEPASMARREQLKMLLH